MVHWEKSYIYGKEKEKSVLPTLCEFFNRDIGAYTQRYDDFDFFDNEYEYEMKARTNKYSTYPTTMLTLNKTQKVTNKKIIFLFYFVDGLYYIEYDAQQFNQYEVRKFSRANVSWDEKDHVFIPISDLKKIF